MPVLPDLGQGQPDSKECNQESKNNGLERRYSLGLDDSSNHEWQASNHHIRIHTGRKDEGYEKGHGYLHGSTRTAKSRRKAYRGHMQLRGKQFGRSNNGCWEERPNKVADKGNGDSRDVELRHKPEDEL